MTLTAQRLATGDGKNIKVQIIYGPVTASIEEHESHIRWFRDQLNQLLDGK